MQTPLPLARLHTLCVRPCQASFLGSFYMYLAVDKRQVLKLVIALGTPSGINSGGRRRNTHQTVTIPHQTASNY